MAEGGEKESYTSSLPVFNLNQASLSFPLFRFLESVT